MATLMHRGLTQGVGRGDRVAVMTSNRVEFVAAVHAASKVGAAAVVLSPAWKAVEVDHALGLTAPRHAITDGPAAPLLADRLGGDAVTDLDDPATASAATAQSRARPAAAADGRDTDDVILVFSSAPPGSPRRCATRAGPWATPPRTGARPSASAPTTASRWRHLPRTSSACSTCSPRPRPAPPSGCTGGSTSTRCWPASRASA